MVHRDVLESNSSNLFYSGLIETSLDSREHKNSRATNAWMKIHPIDLSSNIQSILRNDLRFTTWYNQSLHQLLLFVHKPGFQERSNSA